MSGCGRTFGTTTGELEALAQWLAAEGVSHVAMESTGVLWKPVFNILEGRFAVILVNAQHIKAVPGRKTDVRDCEWLAQLLEHGLLRPRDEELEPEDRRAGCLCASRMEAPPDPTGSDVGYAPWWSHARARHPRAAAALLGAPAVHAVHCARRLTVRGESL